jgi:hypothetical protein
MAKKLTVKRIPTRPESLAVATEIKTYRFCACRSEAVGDAVCAALLDHFHIFASTIPSGSDDAYWVSGEARLTKSEAGKACAFASGVVVGLEVTGAQWVLGQAMREELKLRRKAASR